VQGQKEEELGASKRATSDADDAADDAAAGDGTSVKGSKLTLKPCMSSDVIRAPCTCQMM
jgi:hypothetical protein